MARYASGSDFILKEGVTTANGAAGGTTVVDASLIGKPDFPTGLQVRILSGTYQHVTRTIESFATATGTMTVPASNPFPGQIVSGTGYVIMGVTATSSDVLTLVDDIHISAAEELKDFIAKTGGTEIGAAKSLTDALGHTGLARLDSGLDGVLADGLINGAGTVLPTNTSLFGLLQGIVYHGAVTTYTDTTHFKSTNFIGFGTDFFKNYYVYVVRDAAGAAPQGESQQISAYTSADGTITHTTFTTPLAATDEVLLIHKDVAELKDILDLARTEGNVSVSTIDVELFLDNAPTRAIEGKSVKVDLSAMVAGDSIILREWYRITIGGAWIQFSLDAANTYIGAQTPSSVTVHLDAYRYGAKVTAIKSAVPARVLNYESFVEA